MLDRPELVRLRDEAHAAVRLAGTPEVIRAIVLEDSLHLLHGLSVRLRDEAHAAVRLAGHTCSAEEDRRRRRQRETAKERGGKMVIAGQRSEGAATESEAPALQDGDAAKGAGCEELCTLCEHSCVHSVWSGAPTLVAWTSGDQQFSIASSPKASSLSAVLAGLIEPSGISPLSCKPTKWGRAAVKGRGFLCLWRQCLSSLSLVPGQVVLGFGPRQHTRTISPTRGP